MSAFVSRGALKLEHALDTFALDVRGLVCADFGASTGGFTDSLLRRGAAKVYAVDTAWGTLDWRLRSDERVIVMERTNALHAEIPERVDLAVVDLGWTVQRLAIPAALRWLSPEGRIVTLLKPHYEARDEERALLNHGALAPDDAQRIADRVIASMPELGAEVLGRTLSPITGAKSARRGEGNAEYLVLLAAAAGR